MKIINSIFILIALIAITFILVYTYFGGFINISVYIAPINSEVIIYKDVIGDYRKTRLIIDTIQNNLKNEFQIETLKTFGIYFDNPQNIEKNKLRSEVGCILQNKDLDKLPLLEKKYKTRTLQQKEYINSEFPFYGKPSILIGIMKVYPAINEYVEENNYDPKTPVMEVYDFQNHAIYYRKELKVIE